MTGFKIALSLITESQEFQALQARDARSAALRHGSQIDIVYAASDPVTQVRQLFQFIHVGANERPSAIIVEPASGDGYERAARSAVAEGIGWVLINAELRYLAELRAQRPDLPISCVRVDNAEVGWIQARQLRALLPKGGAVLCLQGPPRSAVSKDRLQGMRDGLSGSAITTSLIQADWTEQGGEQAAATWLRTRSPLSALPRVVACQNDSMAIGARRALMQGGSKWKDIAFTGCDGLPEGGQRQVRSSELKATIITASNTGPAVDLIIAHLSGRESAPPSVRLAPTSYPSVASLLPLPELPSG